MLLVVDAGNTNIVFAIHDGKKWLGNWRISTNHQRTSDEYAVWLIALIERKNIPIQQIKKAIIGTVVPAALYHLRLLCRRWFFVEPIIVSSALNWGFQIKIDNPEEVGADRLLNGLAAYQLYHAPLIVIDFGTATTFDVIDKDGNYCGGIIAPGINLSLEALHSAAARLPRIGIGRPLSVVGKGTVAAMKSGIFWGYIGLVEGIVNRIKKEVSADLKVIATGGLALLLSEGTPIFEEINPELTLEGLKILADRNLILKNK